MAVSNGNAALNKYIKDNYPDSKGDLFAAFIERCWKYCSQYLAMITQHSWMFLSSFEKLRTKLLYSADIVSMAHLGARAFEEIGGEVVQTTSFVLRMGYHEGFRGTYCRLVEPTTQQGKEDMFLADENRYVAEQVNYFKIPGSPVAYWVSQTLMASYGDYCLSEFATVTNGLFTCDNKRFLRLWYEVNLPKIEFHCTSKTMCCSISQKWFPYNKGGEFRRWYGNQEYVVNFKDFGSEISAYRVQSGQSATFPGQDFYFQESISWSLVSTSRFGIRYYPKGFVFDIAGSSIFPNDYKYLHYLLGFLSSDVAFNCLKLTNPTINFQAGDVRKLPLIFNKLYSEIISEKVEDSTVISKQDWDSYETSWDFNRHPLV